MTPVRVYVVAVSFSGSRVSLSPTRPCFPPPRPPPPVPSLFASQVRVAFIFSAAQSGALSSCDAVLIRSCFCFAVESLRRLYCVIFSQTDANCALFCPHVLPGTRVSGGSGAQAPFKGSRMASALYTLPHFVRSLGTQDPESRNLATPPCPTPPFLMLNSSLFGI